MNCILNWHCFLDSLNKYEAVAVWLEGIALVAIFIWDRIDANHDHKETIAQLKIAQEQIKISQNAERAWVMTRLDWGEGLHDSRVVTQTSKQGVTAEDRRRGGDAPRAARER